MANRGIRVGGMAKYHGKTYKVISLADNEHTVILKDLANGETVRAHAFEVIANASVSSNAVVNAALAWKERTAGNAKSDILDYVKKTPYAESVSRDGYTVMYTSKMIPEDKAEKVYREVERYLAKRVKVGLCRFVTMPLAPVIPYGKTGGGGKSFRLSVSIPDLAVANSAIVANGKFKVGDYVLYEGHGEGYRRGRIVSLGGSVGPIVEWVGGGRDSVPFTRLTPCNSAAPDSSVAANAGVREGNYQVTIETVDFSGNRTQSKNLTASQLKTWLSLIHCDGSDRFLDEIASSSRREVHFNLDMHPTIRIKAM